jgi:hypothetical protein
MIQYFHHRSIPPPWMVGAPGLCHREVLGGFVWGVGYGFMLMPPPDNAIELVGGYKAWMNDDGPNPEYLYRPSPWIRTFVVSDSRDRTWSIPVILNGKGKRAFKVAYDHEWKPALTSQQAKLMNWADEAAQFLQDRDIAGEVIDPAPGCAWAAEFISEVNFITPEVIGKLHLMDDILMLSTLMGATSRTIEEASNG